MAVRRGLYQVVAVAALAPLLAAGRAWADEPVPAPGTTATRGAEAALEATGGLEPAPTRRAPWREAWAPRAAELALAPEAEAAPAPRIYSRPMRTAGLVLGGFAVVAIPVGGVVYWSGTRGETNGCEYGIACLSTGAGKIAGETLMALGVAALLVGIPMFMTGSRPARPAWASPKMAPAPGGGAEIARF